MPYLLFVLALIVGIVNGAPLSGFLLGAALCYTVHTAQKAQRESGGTQALRQEIQDLRRRVRLLEAQIRPSENPSADVCEPPQAENGGVQKRYPCMPETGTAFSPQTEMAENETPPSPALPPRHARADVSALARLRAQRQDGTMHGAPTQAAITVTSKTISANTKGAGSSGCSFKAASAVRYITAKPKPCNTSA